MVVMIYMLNNFISKTFNFGFTFVVPKFLTFVINEAIFQILLIYMDVAITNQLPFSTFTYDKFHDGVKWKKNYALGE